jgi:hypothetical protein
MRTTNIMKMKKVLASDLKRSPIYLGLKDAGGAFLFGKADQSLLVHWNAP